MKHLFSLLFIALFNVGLAALMGASDSAGLFGAIIGVGFYAARAKGGAA